MKHKYHIGMDAHSKNSTFAVMDNRGRVRQRATVATNETELLGFVRSVRGTKALTFEETMLSQWLYVLMKDEVDELVVCDPKPNKRVGAKTDKIDAIELADLLCCNRCAIEFVRIRKNPYSNCANLVTRSGFRDGSSPGDCEGDGITDRDLLLIEKKTHRCLAAP